MLSFFFVDTVGGGTIEDGRTAATTALIVLGLCFILLLERGPGGSITIQSYMLAMIAGLGALYAAILAIEPVRTFFVEILTAGNWFWRCSRWRSACSWRRRVAAAIHPGARGASGRGAARRRRPGADPYSRTEDFARVRESHE